MQLVDSRHMRKRKQETRAKWRGLVAEQQRRGKSMAGFCRVRGVCAPHSFAWKKWLKREVSEA